MWKKLDPRTEMEALQREIERVFEGFGRSGNQGWGRSLFLPGHHARAYPRLTMSEDAEAVHVEALAPGLDMKKLNLSLTGNTLTIQGEKTPVTDVKPEQYHRNERATGTFLRTLEIGTEVNVEKIYAQYVNGVLIVDLPKSEKVKPKQIDVKVR
jgi:HSP20 family protein